MASQSNACQPSQEKFRVSLAAKNSRQPISTQAPRQNLCWKMCKMMNPLLLLLVCFVFVSPPLSVCDFEQERLVCFVFVSPPLSVCDFEQERLSVRDFEQESASRCKLREHDREELTRLYPA